MKDPYSVLGLNPNATDDEVKQAYRELAKKYHPDNFQNSPLAGYATKKMAEINEAYDQIISERRAAKKNAESEYYDYNAADVQNNSNYIDVRSLINSGRFDDAEMILNGVPVEGRDAEWYFLNGVIKSNKGWLDEAYGCFQTACNMDPSNREYNAAFNRIKNSRSGVGGYDRGGNFVCCTPCDICSGLICTDCLCDCCCNSF